MTCMRRRKFWAQAPRLLLHAAMLAFSHPVSGEWLAVTQRAAVLSAELSGWRQSGLWEAC